ncbi:MAG: PQQ-dependent sugar dehydrogenase [Dehalococcoidia bacterium]
MATGLEVPWALAFAPDGRMFLTERPGRLRVISGGVLLPQPCWLPAFFGQFWTEEIRWVNGDW